MNAIETKALTKYYGKSRGIEAIDLTVEKGDFFGCIGPNGAGKSTLIRTLLGLISPTGGSGNVLGLDIVKDKTEILSKVGYLPSETAFYHGMKVKEVLRLSANLRKKDCTQMAKQLCERLELDINKKVETLSFGNRKKVGIVCALQHEPELYILDEPTSGLDPLMQKEFFTILKERNEAGATVFLSSHVLPEVARHCRHAAVIREGSVLVSDKVENLGHTGVKQVSLRGVETPPNLSGVEHVEQEGEQIRFLYSGGLQELIQALAAVPMQDITITDPDLEEVFLHYYEKGGAEQ